MTPTTQPKTETMKTQYIKHADGNTYYFADKAMTITHRADGPAIIGNHGSKFWWINGELHNPDGPAVTYPNGYKQWWINGKELTEEEFDALTNPQPNQPMEIQYVQNDNGNTYYYSDRDMTILHRLDGPAAIGPNGYTAHYINGLLHNPDGPAVTWPDGYKSWVINGKELSEAEFNALTLKADCPSAPCSPLCEKGYYVVKCGFGFDYQIMRISRSLNGLVKHDYGWETEKEWLSRRPAKIERPTIWDRIGNILG